MLPASRLKFKPLYPEATEMQLPYCINKKMQNSALVIGYRKSGKFAKKESHGKHQIRLDNEPEKKLPSLHMRIHRNSFGFNNPHIRFGVGKANFRYDGPGHECKSRFLQLSTNHHVFSLCYRFFHRWIVGVFLLPRSAFDSGQVQFDEGFASNSYPFGP